MCREGSIQVVIAYRLSPELNLDDIVEANKQLLQALPDQKLTLGSETFDTVDEKPVITSNSDITTGSRVIGKIVCIIHEHYVII